MVPKLKHLGTVALLEFCDNLFASYSGQQPGASVLIVQEGEIRLSRNYGLANVGTRIPWGPKTNYRLASVSKQFTATAICLLTDRSQLGLNECLLDFFPGFPCWGKSITVRHLLRHTSGVPDYEPFFSGPTGLPATDYDVLRTLMSASRAYFESGSRFRYSNSGYALLAQMVEVRSGSTFPNFLQQNVFQPLGMVNTVAFESGRSTVSHRALGYAPNLTANTKKRPSTFRLNDQSRTSAVLGDGGIYSSTQDFCSSDRALASHPLFGRSVFKEMFRAGTISNRPPARYGFGWYLGSFRGQPEQWHNGTTCGFTTHISRFPIVGLTLVILTNRQGAALRGAIHSLASVCLERGF